MQIGAGRKCWLMDPIAPPFKEKKVIAQALMEETIR
jgi:hypothetical protein